MRDEWRTWKIQPMFADRHGRTHLGNVGPVRSYYAPNLDTAFMLARVDFPVAIAWRAL